MKFPIFYLVASLLAWPAVANAEYAEQIDVPFERYVLDNGLTLLVHEDHKAPVVAVNIWYHVGSKNERPGITGFAHLFEHLMFNGTENYDGEWFLPLEEVGATDLNGTTWFDRTNYFQTVPVTALDRILWMESDRMGHLLGAITQEKLDEQRGVVQNEKRQGDNRPYGRASYLQLAGMFPEGHPYSWDTIGSMEDLDAASLDDVKEWFETYYGAANAVLVIAGAVDADEIYDKVVHYFGDINSGPALSKPEQWIAKRTESRRDVMYDNVAQARLTKAWNTPPYGDQESAWLELAGEVLGGGKNSRLYERLVYNDQIATSASAYQQPFELAGMFEIEAYAKPGVELSEIEAAINEELQRFLDEGPTDEELERVKAGRFAQIIRGLEKVGGFGGKAQLLAEYETYMGDANYYRTDLEYLESATPEQVRDAARKWLSSGDYNLEVLPQPNYRTTADGADRSQMPGTGESPQLVFPEVEEFLLESGIRVLLAERHSVPLVSMQLQFNAGIAAEQGRPLGIAGLTAAMLDEGTRNLDALEISSRLESLGARIGSGSSLDTNSVSLSSLKANLEPSLDLFTEVVRHPTFPEQELERVRIGWLAGIDQELTDPNSMALRQLPPLLYGEGHPYAVPFTGSGTHESINSITRDDLLAFHRDWLHSANATLIVVGDTTRDEIEPLLNDAFGDWQPAPGAQYASPIADASVPQAPVIYLLNKPESPQSMIIGGQLLPPKKADETDRIDMALRIFGGTFNARLNMNLREEKGWSYGARAVAPDTAGQRPMIYMAPVQADKTVESLREILREADEYLADRPATEDELERAREGILRSLPGRYETNGAVLGKLGEIVQFDLPLDDVEQSQARLRAMTLDDVRSAANGFFTPDRSIWLVVGDLSVIEQPLRDAGIAEVVVLDD